MVVEDANDTRLAIKCDGDELRGPDRWTAAMQRQRILERAGWAFWRGFASTCSLRKGDVLAECHTSRTLEQAFLEAFGRNGWRVAVNDPFAGALVPVSQYRADPRVTAVMAEVNRDLYLDHKSFEPNSDFGQVAAAIKDHCIDALARCSAEYPSWV